MESFSLAIDMVSREVSLDKYFEHNRKRTGLLFILRQYEADTSHTAPECVKLSVKRELLMERFFCGFVTAAVMLVVFACASGGGSIGEQGLAVGNAEIEVSVQLGHSSVNSQAFSPDGKCILSASSDNTVKLWDTNIGREILTFSDHPYPVNVAAFSPDGKTVASGSFGTTYNSWPPLVVQYLRGLEDRTAHGDNTVRVWDAATGNEIHILRGYSAMVYSIAFSPDGKTIASSSVDTTIKLWDAVTGRELRTLSGHTQSVCSVSFSPDGSTVISASGDGTVMLWDTATGRKILRIDVPSSWVNSAAFHPNGKSVISASADGVIRLWDIATGNEIASFIAFNNGEWIVVTPDGYYNASPNGGRYLNVRIGNEVFAMDQFAATFYRPEVVTARL